MDHRFTFSIFTIEINGRPTLALQAKLHKDAEHLCEHGQLRTKLSTITSHGTPLCDASATMKVRLATAEEAVLSGCRRFRLLSTAAVAQARNVRYGSWLCENAKALNRDRKSYSSKTVLVAERASAFNLEIELKNIILRRVSIF